MYLHDPQHTGRSPYRGPQLGDLEWSANPAQQHELNTGIAVGPDSTLYFFSSAYLVALDLDGSEKWLFKFSDDVFGWPAETTPLIGANGTIYVTSLDKFLYAIRPDGTLGQKAFIDVFINDLTLDFEGTLYAVGDDRHLYAIDKSGSILWNLFLDTGFFPTCPAFSPDGSTLYVSGWDSALYAISASGIPLWMNNLEGRFYKRGLLVDNQGNIYVQPTRRGNFPPGEVIAFNPDSTLRWKYRYSDESVTRWSSPTMDRNGYLYFVDELNDRIISLDYSGKLRWITPYPSNPSSGYSPLVCDSDGTVYSVISFSPYSVIAIDSGGQITWAASAPYQPFAHDAPPTIGPTGRLYVTGDYEMLLYCYR